MIQRRSSRYGKALFVFFAALSTALLAYAAYVLLDELSYAGETPLRVKLVEIKGAKVRLPIPDGYEEMQREDHPETYDWMVKVTSDEKILPLIFLIHSDDKALLRKDSGMNFRYGIACSDSTFWNATVHDSSMEHIRSNFKKYAKKHANKYNQKAREQGKPEWSYEYIFDGIKSISTFQIEREVEAGYKYRQGYTESYVVSDKKVIEYILYKNFFSTDDIHDIKSTTIAFLKKIDRNSY